MGKVLVGLDERSYPIIIEQDCRLRVGEYLADAKIAKRYCVIADDCVASLYGQELIASLHVSGIPCELVTFPQGENSKNLSTLGMLAGRLTKLGFDRKDAIIGFGGGVTGDLAGFLASSYMRGIKFVQIPTTLLAQVDSSVGGKTAVDIPEGKNLVGAFYQPQAVYIDPFFLTSLPREELLGGLAEVIKYGVIWDREFFDFLQANRERILALEPGLIEKTIATCCQIKAEVVSNDERENGLRRILNYGHTIGHAVESTSELTLIHGLAVSIGMVAAAKLAVLTNRLDAVSAEKIVSLLTEYGMPTKIPKEYDRKKIKNYLLADKKVIDGKIHFVLPVSIGKVNVVSDVTMEEIDNVLR
jgi:3-dehydroquinate synthase